MPDYDHYQLTISTLTPLHIGSGEVLLKDYDYAVHRGHTWRIDFPTWLEQQTIEDPAYAEQLAAQPPASLMTDDDFQPDSPYFRYIMRGTPRSSAQGIQVREQIKDWQDQPYLPGSSLKGQLRTALGWHLWQQKGLKPDPAGLDRRKQWAARNVERILFGRDPNHDLLRALEIGDSLPIPSERLMLINVNVLNQDGKLASPIEMEAVRPDSTFTMEVKVDQSLFSEWARKHGLHLTGESALNGLPAIVNQRSLERLQKEANWFRQIPNGSRVANVYAQFLKTNLSPNQIILQLGWGTGWEDKTFGTRLSSHSGFFESVIQQYDLARGKHQRGRPFPASRRVAVSSRRDAVGRVEETPAMPLGWVLVTFESKRGTNAWTASNRSPRPQKFIQSDPAAQPAPNEPVSPPRQEAVHTAPQAASPARHPAPVQSERRPILQLFTAAPRQGDRFIGKVVNGSEDIVVELPGLDGDQFFAWIPAQDAGKPRPKEGAKLRCEVMSVDPDPENKGGWLVRCRLI